MAAVLEASKWLDDPANRVQGGRHDRRRALRQRAARRDPGPPHRHLRPRRRPRREGLRRRPDARSSATARSTCPRRAHVHLGPGPVPAPRAASTRRPTYEELADELILTDLYAEVADGRGRRRPRRRHGAVRGQARRRHLRPGGARRGGRPTVTIIEKPLAPTGARSRPPRPRRTAGARAAPASDAAGGSRSAPRHARLGGGRLRRRWSPSGRFGASKVPELPTPGEAFATLRDAARRPVLRQRPQRQGHRPPAASTRCSRVFIGLRPRRRSSASRSGCAIGASRRAWQAANPVDPAAAAGVAAGLVPDLARRLQGQRQRRGVGDLHHRRCGRRVLNTAAGAAAVPDDQRNVARVFRFGRRRLPAPRARAPHAARRSSPACGCRWASPGW